MNLIAIVHSCFADSISSIPSALEVFALMSLGMLHCNGIALLISVVEYLYDELDGVSDLMSPVQPLLTQRVYILTLPWHSWTPLDGKELG